MAQWSPGREHENKRQLRRLGERLDLIAKLRKAGWSCEVFDATGEPVEETIHGVGIYFKVTMPGACPVIVREMDALRRLANGAR